MTPQTEIDFSKPKKRGYSIETSLPALKENSAMKARYVAMMVGLVSQGFNTLKALQKASGLPQSSVAGRVNQAIDRGLLRYNGITEADGRKRKKIECVQ